MTKQSGTNNLDNKLSDEKKENDNTSVSDSAKIEEFINLIEKEVTDRPLIQKRSLEFATMMRRKEIVPEAALTYALLNNKKIPIHVIIEAEQSYRAFTQNYVVDYLRNHEKKNELITALDNAGYKHASSDFLKSKETRLLSAVKEGDVDLVEEFLKEEVDPNLEWHKDQSLSTLIEAIRAKKMAGKLQFFL